MSHPAFSLQKAIYQTLSNDTELQAFVENRVFDFIPQDSAYPYLQLTIAHQIDRSNQASTLTEISLDIKIYSDSQGASENLSIQKRVGELLNHISLTLDNGHSMSQLYHAGTDQKRDDTGTYIFTQHYTSIVMSS